jgi:hypothetical protein
MQSLNNGFFQFTPKSDNHSVFDLICELLQLGFVKIHVNKQGFLIVGGYVSKYPLLAYNQPIKFLKVN